MVRSETACKIYSASRATLNIERMHCSARSCSQIGEEILWIDHALKGAANVPAGPDPADGGKA
jgi:hypothetical protein